MIIYHIGLPKTATTFLQYRVFNRAFRGSMMHRSIPREPNVCIPLERLLHDGSGNMDDISADLRTSYIGDLLLVSDEVLCMRGGDFWRNSGKTPEEIITLLKEVAGPVPCKFMIGTRRQDTWLASWYAYCSRWFKKFNQSDFERRVSDRQLESSQNAKAWLHYGRLYESLTLLAGEDNVMFYSMERIESEPTLELERMSAFCQTNLVEAYKMSLEASDDMMLNKISTSQDTWRLLGSDCSLILRDEIRENILSLYRPGNLAFKQYTGISH